MGGGTAPPHISSSEFELAEEESSLDEEFSELSLEFSTHPRKDCSNAKEDDDSEVFGGYGDVGRRIYSNSFDFEADQRRRRGVYREVLESYNELRCRSENLEEAASKILSYYPGAWIEEVGGMKLIDYDVPKTTSLLLIGPKGSGKSSLVNKISRVFEDDKFAPDRAQVSYNTSVGDGTYFLREYMIPRGSSSFCLYDTRSFSDDSSANMEMLTHWMKRGVRHGELVIRDSDSPILKTRMKCKARQHAYSSSGIRMVNFVIFVVNGVSILKSMYGDDDVEKQYTEMVASTFSCPFLLFRDDKPVIVVTHGDLLSISDRARVRVHLGELLGVHPTKQIFDIPESCDRATELAIVDMLHYSLEHADRNLPCKERSSSQVFKKSLPACLFLLIVLGIAIIAAHINGTRSHMSHMPHAPPPNASMHCVPPPPPPSAHMHRAPPPPPPSALPSAHMHCASSASAQTHPVPSPPPPGAHTHKHRAPPPGARAHKHRASPPNDHIDWNSIRYLWLGSDYD
ncbi:P-loop containing nucleoside triphosphate hydrolases superfamily protein [Actinidia rufa]|uniref:P-loop containing nucleoside triphosphate hydrolases superfamily protein n=1 Tax=Actinidia rufa TaxID=165716 RepID=A0A7J0GRS4_9ERIC|nr:P-loop containing nucleoside triphosphate hydrolases superfamily protein [Actinidia rufa]